MWPNSQKPYAFFSSCLTSNPIESGDLEGPAGYPHVLLQGALRPDVFCGQNASAQNIAAVLEKAWRPGAESSFFPRKWRVVESDEFKGNVAGERLVKAMHKEYHLLHFGCACHKVHSAAMKTWLLQKVGMQGIARTTLLFEQVGLHSFLGLLKKHIHRHVKVVTPQPLSREAMEFKSMFVDLFSPPGPKL